MRCLLNQAKDGLNPAFSLTQKNADDIKVAEWLLEIEASDALRKRASRAFNKPRTRRLFMHLIPLHGSLRERPCRQGAQP
jgi:hypothetical protein